MSGCGRRRAGPRLSGHREKTLISMPSSMLISMLRHLGHGAHILAGKKGACSHLSQHKSPWQKAWEVKRVCRAESDQRCILHSVLTSTNFFLNPIYVWTGPKSSMSQFSQYFQFSLKNMTWHPVGTMPCAR